MKDLVFENAGASVLWVNVCLAPDPSSLLVRHYLLYPFDENACQITWPSVQPMQLVLLVERR